MRQGFRECVVQARIEPFDALAELPASNAKALYPCTRYIDLRITDVNRKRRIFLKKIPEFRTKTSDNRGRPGQVLDFEHPNLLLSFALFYRLLLPI